MAIDQGDLYRLSFTLTDPDGNAVDADAMSLTIALPDGTSTEIGPIDPVTTGQYQHDYLTTQAGRHVAHWVGTGTHPGSEMQVFDVLGTSIAAVSLADVKRQLNMSTDGSDDELRIYIEAATLAIENHLGQAVVRRTITEDNEIDHGVLVLKRSPVVSLTSLASLDGMRTWDVSTLHVTEAGVVRVRLAFPFQHDQVTVSYVAGPADVASNVYLAALVIVEHLWQTKRGQRGPARAGGLEDTMMPRGLGFAIPNRAIELLGDGMPGVA